MVFLVPPELITLTNITMEAAPPLGAGLEPGFFFFFERNSCTAPRKDW